MPDLPTLTVTQEQADRMIAAYGSVANYRAWLKQKIVAFVLDYEMAQQDQQYTAQRESFRAQARQELEE